tara:strand:+ start:93 stop:332 length:240 start_codon:yes stop_codon:yes gene_type:complete
MKRNFTLDDLFLYHYNELAPEEVQAFELSLKFDEFLSEASDSFQTIKSLLDQRKASPSDASIRLIMDYNKQNSNELEAI